LYLLERIIKKSIETLLNITDEILRRKTYGIWVKSEEFKTQESTLSISRGQSKRFLIYNHRVSDFTYSKFFETLELLIPEVSKVFYAKASLYSWVKNQKRNTEIEVNWHPMGTLPMGSDGTTSICDSNLECHSLKNVFILSPAVFNRGSNGNPTFTSLALCSRLVNETLESRRS
jgi:choline dehydrogenase-like flavoprotein